MFLVQVWNAGMQTMCLCLSL